MKRKCVRVWAHLQNAKLQATESVKYGGNPHSGDIIDLSLTTIKVQPLWLI